MNSEQEKADNIQRALEVGRDTLLQYGVQGIQMQNIGDKAGVSPRSMTRYFGTKENYICAILEKMSKDDLKNADKYAKASHIEKLSGIGQMHMFFDSIPKYYFLQGKKILAIAEAKMYLCNSADYDERVSDVFTSIYKAYTERIQHFLSVGIKDGTIGLKEDTVEFYADSIANTLWGMFFQLTFVNGIQLYSEDYCNKIFRNYAEHVLKAIEVK